uniref:uncharacterized protein n=1 Tax=Semicossyphus pulcher TaxID=241346 RepID=UPI0037E87E97
MERKQTEISTWPLTAPHDAGRYRAALTQIQTQLIEVLNKQRLEKEHLSRKQRSVSHSLWQCVLKSRLVSLALRQRILVKILQKQMHLVKVYVTMKAKLSTQPPNHQHSTDERQQPDQVSPPVSTSASSKARDAHGCDKDAQSHRAVSQARGLRSAPHRACRPPALSHTTWKKAPKHTVGLNKKFSSCQSNAKQTGNTLRHINFEVKRKNALIQMRAGDSSRHLFELIQRGVLQPGGPLQLFMKGHWCRAHVLPDGSLKDLKGRVHPTPERWLESVLGNNIPINSAYAWDKVTFRDKPLSSYTLNLETETHTHPEETVQRCMDSSSVEDLTSEEASLKRLMRIRIIRLVDNEELLPNAVMDFYWEKLLKDDGSDSEWNEL